MLSSSSQKISLSIAKKILLGFEHHYQNIKSASIEAKRCFEEKEWEKIENDSKLRLNFYDEQVDVFCKNLSSELKKQTLYGAKAEFNETQKMNKFNSDFWKNTKHVYIELITSHKQPELAETFYNSVFCRIFSRSFYNNQYIFTKPCVSLNYIDMDEPVIDSYFVDDGQLKETLTSVLNNYKFSCKFGNLDQDIERLQEQLIKQMPRLQSEVFELQFISTPFIRGKCAYIVGKIVTQLHSDVPVLIALLNDENKGLYVDSLLTDIGSISIIFSFSRSYFFITTDYPSAIVEYLKELLPGKTRAVLYSAIGLHKQGKTLLYRHFLKYSKITSEKLIIAPGIKGMVMSVFTFPMYPYVFKVINDQFAPPKMGTKEMVKDRYYFVKNHVRIGRLADTWEFSNVAFPLKDIDDALLKELEKKASSNIEIENDLLIIKHMYIENKMTPLNMYLETANIKQQNHIINDYGKAIDELINSNIFPGDMLTKNFGVTRQNRVVFYDYDEITLMSTPIFKKIPKAKTYEQEMASEPWYYVGQNDVFPEEFKYFMLPNPYMKEVFNKKYKKLLDADYWVSIQEKIKQNGVMDYYPYGSEKRMCEIYNDN
ncbi:bifunctional isocitrate dehydrogenase kinase/phosphatase [Candidatus Pseudothioglobus singularis]|nr:bifunctional isocitrate dehydrogenase kinase/phosphatase [Candidatus Pseudothioglobus singularis]MDB4598407.1 bifunctional isocitrate dehydrogenase kinase/phosphatase [Candidatus Pseudothioglobus singularis]